MVLWMNVIPRVKHEKILFNFEYSTCLIHLAILGYISTLYIFRLYLVGEIGYDKICVF